MRVALGGLLAASVVAASLRAFDAGRISVVIVAVLAFLALGSAEAVPNLPDSFARLAAALGGARRILALAPSQDNGSPDVQRHRQTGESPDGRRGREGRGGTELRMDRCVVVIEPSIVPTIELTAVWVDYVSQRRRALELCLTSLAASLHLAQPLAQPLATDLLAAREAKALVWITHRHFDLGAAPLE